MNTTIQEDGKPYFFYYYQFLFLYVNYNYQLRNYIFFNRILINNNEYKEFGNEKMTKEKFMEIVDIKNNYFIQPSFEEDTLGKRFTCEYLHRAFGS